jgi:hypothetical protein
VFSSSIINVYPCRTKIITIFVHLWLPNI